MGSSPIDSLMFTTFSLKLAALKVLEMLNFMRIFFNCFGKVRWFFFSVISYGNSHYVEFLKLKQKIEIDSQSFFQYFSQIKYNLTFLNLLVFSLFKAFLWCNCWRTHRSSDSFDIVYSFFLNIIADELVVELNLHVLFSQFVVFSWCNHRCTHRWICNPM